MIQQLDPPVPMTVKDKGDGFAFLVIDYGMEHDLLWVVGITATGEVWAASNRDVRLTENWTYGRKEQPTLKIEPCHRGYGVRHRGPEETLGGGN